MAASQGTVKREVLATLSIKGRIGGPNPMSTLCSLTHQDGEAGKRQVEAAVRDLSREGLVGVKRDKGRILEIFHKKPRENYDRTEMSAEAKRQHMFAKGIPAFLPDDKCSEVTVRYAPGRELKVEEPSAPSAEYLEGGPLLDNLNACLTALRQMADADGVAAETSVRAVLLMLPGMTESSAGRMMDFLQGMGLYVTRKTGFRKSSYTVNLDVRGVTDEMLAEFRQKRRKQSESSTPVSTDDTAQAVGEEQDVTDPVVAGLLEVIEGLERDKAELEDALVAARSQLDFLSEELTEADLKAARLEHELAQASKRPLKDPRAAAVLERYGKMA